MSRYRNRVLVVFATSSGCTETIARRIATDLIGQGLRPHVVSVMDGVNLDDDYAGFIFGSGVRMGRWHNAGIKWLNNNLPLLEGRPFALFSVGLQSVEEMGNSKQAYSDHERCTRAFSPYEPVSGEVFTGWKRTEGFSLVEKVAMKVMPLDEGDYRNWDKVDSWVRSIAPFFRESND